MGVGGGGGDWIFQVRRSKTILIIRNTRYMEYDVTRIKMRSNI